MKCFYYVVAVTVMFATACGGESKRQAVVSEITLKSKINENNKSTVSNDETVHSADSTVKASADIVNAATPSIDWDKKIIKTANIRLELKDYNRFNQALHSSLKVYGAYVSEENQTNNEYKLENSISIKVPVQNFENLINSFSGDSVKIIEKKITSQDVKGEVVDTKARLDAKKRVRERYLDLLKQANKMEDIISVQKEIDAIQEDIESADGHIDYLQHSAAYSTINLVYYQYMEQGSVYDDGQPGYFHRFVTAFKEGAAGLYTLILGLITIWPLILLGLLAFFYMKKRWRSAALKK